ncbi:MAG TPA: nucleotidyltransferase family protein [Candidatus Binatia bacterium]|nr:nucleotidyltransferase family protein [Candidatus Binatia bacterium]
MTSSQPCSVSPAAGDPSVRAVSRRALIAAVHPDPRGFAEIAAADARRIDWRWVLHCARAHKIAALVAARMEVGAVMEHIDEGVSERLRDIRCRTHLRVDAAVGTLHQLAREFTRAEIPFLVIKGSVLAEHVYGNPELRPFEDVDVVVSPDRVTAAERVMRALGYRFSQIRQLLSATPRNETEARLAELVTRRFYERFHYELPFAPASREGWLPVDVHWHIAPRARLPIHAAQLWNHTSPTVVAGVPVATLDLEATLIHLALHASTCSLAGFRLLPLCDVAWATTRFGDQYQRLWALADAWGVRSQVETVLTIVDRVLGVPPPERIRREMSPSVAGGFGFPAVARPAFLIDQTDRASVSWPRRVYNELLWDLAMRCLGYNVIRGVRVRASRLRWRLMCWRARGSSRG